MTATPPTRPIADVKATASRALDDWLREPSRDTRACWFEALGALLKHPDTLDAAPEAVAADLNWAARGFLAHYRAHRQVPALKSVLEFTTTAERTATAGTAGAAEAHGMHSSALLSLYRVEGKADDLENARRHAEQAVSMLEPDTPKWGNQVGNLAVVVLDAYFRQRLPADLHEALRLFDLAAAALHNEPSALAVLLSNQAEARLAQLSIDGRVEHLEEAIEGRRKALDLLPADDEERPWAVTRLAATLRAKATRLGHRESLAEAISLLEQLRREPRSRRDLERGETHLAASRLAEHRLFRSVDALDSAIAILVSVCQRDSKGVEAGALELLGEAFLERYRTRFRVGDLEQAVSVLLRAVSLIPTNAGGGAQSKLGNALLERYHHARSSPDLDAAIRAYRLASAAPDEPATTAIHLNNLGNGLLLRYRHGLDQGFLDEAVLHYRDSLALGGTAPDRSRHLANLAAALTAQVRETKDSRPLEEAVTLLEEARSLVAEGTADHAQRTDALARTLATLSSQTGRPEAHRRALDLWRSVLSPQHRFMYGPGGAAFSCAIGLLKSGQTIDERREAISLLQACFDEIWRRRWAGDAASMLGHQRQLSVVAEALVEALLKHAGAPPEAPAAERRAALAGALLIVEATKSNILADHLTLVEVPASPVVPAHLLAREQEIIARLKTADRIEDLGVEVEELTDASVHDHRIQRLQARVIAYAELLKLWDEMTSTGDAGARYADFRRGRPLSWEAIEALFQRGTGNAAVVSLHIGTFNLCLFVTRAGWTYPRIFHQPFSRDDVEVIRRRYFREIPTDPWGMRQPTWHRPLTQLFERARDCIRDADMVVLSLPGELWDLPFVVVTEQSGWAKQGCLLPLATVPTLTVLDRLRPADALQRRGSALVVGNPTLDLQHAAAEARAVSRRLGVEPLLAEDATVGEVRDRIEDAWLVHLAAHGQHSANDPLGSGIRLQDGTLSARDILSLHLRAELVVLSACDSGLLAELPGEELLGLGQALLQAGARAVVMSLWHVDDASTTEVMSRFYDHYLADLGPPQAMARAMESLRTKPGYRHPYYWAPFVVMGDWRPLPQEA